MPKLQLHQMLDDLAKYNRTKLITIVALARKQAGLGVMLDKRPVFEDDMGWRIRIIKMIKDLCWFYDRMCGHETAQLEEQLHRIIMEIKGQE
jgi:hypothetical protein